MLILYSLLFIFELFVTDVSRQSVHQKAGLLILSIHLNDIFWTIKLLLLDPTARNLSLINIKVEAIRSQFLWEVWFPVPNKAILFLSQLFI